MESGNVERKQVREGTRRGSGIVYFLTCASLLLSIAALGLSCYNSIRALEIEKDQTDIGYNLVKRQAAENDESADLVNFPAVPKGLYSILQGPPGRDGRDGRDCSPVKIEEIVDTLSQHLAISEDEIIEKFNKSFGSTLFGNVQQILKNMELPGGLLRNNRVGATYIRWGRTICGTDSERIYEGFAAGQHYNHYGGASNYQCLPLHPEHSATSAATSSRNYIYGAEYQSTSNVFPIVAQDENVPCALCYTAGRSATVTIPAKRNCPEKWTKEYEGYLMAGYYNHKHSYNYVCVDSHPEAVVGRGGNEDGALFYATQTSCPSIGHCPPYIEGSELTCVVCSK